MALYSSIPQEDAVNAVKTTLDNRNSEQKDNMPTTFLVNLLQMILQFNTFEFDESFFQQLIGIAMGTVSAPSIANIDMGQREQIIFNPRNSSHTQFIYRNIWKRCIETSLFSFKVLKNSLKL